MNILFRDPHKIEFLTRLVGAIARGIMKLGFTPMVLTILGFVLGVGSAILIGLGWFLPAFFVLLASSVSDAIDGTIARARNQTSRQGAFLDSVLDRYVDMAVLFGIAMYFIRQGDQGMALVTFFAVVGVVVISYTAARASSLGVNYYSGFMGRFQRLVVLLFGILVPVSLPVVVWIIAILGNVAAIHRSVQYLKMLNVAPESREPLEQEAVPVKEPL